MTGTTCSYDVVIPSIGRPSLARVLDALAAGEGPRPRCVIVVDDRPDPAGPLLRGMAPDSLDMLIKVVRGRARGPAAARNDGWRHAAAEWVAFLDDDVVPEPRWAQHLVDDLAGLPAGVAASQGRITVPLPADRGPTDWERNVAGLEHAHWATADMAYRRSVLHEVGGFDERFPRAYREDADLALRVLDAGYRLVQGARQVTHPVRPADRWVSIRTQAGNGDDVLMAAVHGPDWRARAGVPQGRFRRHATIAGAGAGAAVALVARRPRLAATAGAVWLAGTAELAVARILPGPRTADEIVTMTATSVAMPFVATFHRLAGLARRRRLLADVDRAPVPAPQPPQAVLLDRDGTLVVDVPYNGDPARVQLVPGARQALDRLRAAGVRTAVVSNQSGVGRGLLSIDDVHAVNRRVEELAGPLGPWFVCPHAPDDDCTCRKPRPGLVLEAAARLGVDPSRCAVVGDIGADIEAAEAAGARGVLVPTPVTRAEEIAAAAEVAPDLVSAVDLLLGHGGDRRDGGAGA